MTPNDLKCLQMTSLNLLDTHSDSFGVLLAVLQKCSAAQKCTVLFLSVSTTVGGDSDFASYFFLSLR